MNALIGYIDVIIFAQTLQDLTDAHAILDTGYVVMAAHVEVL